MFAHVGPLHILFNMYTLYSFGTPLTGMLGPRRFLAVYMLSGLAGGLAQVNYPAIARRLDFPATYKSRLRDQASLGASGAVLGLVGCMAALAPHTQATVFFIPMSLRVLLPVISGLSLWAAWDGADFGGMQLGHLGHFAHVGGITTGLMLGMLMRGRSVRY
jgi:membrane associated rhomboid family serine protease